MIVNELMQTDVYLSLKKFFLRNKIMKLLQFQIEVSP